MKRKVFLRWFFGTLFVLTGLFYLFTVPVMWYHDMPLTAGFDFKFIALSAVNLVLPESVLTFAVDLPEELLPYMYAAGLDPVVASVPAAYYPLYVKLVPHVGWMYTVSLYWFAAAILIGIIVGGVKVSQQDTESTAKKQSHIRGAEKATAKQLTKALKKQGGTTTGITIGDLKLPTELETRHILVLGTTGTGKSYLLMSIIKQFQQRGVKMVVLDRKGEFFANFGQPGKDKLFNPYDTRHQKWNIFNEFSLPSSLDHMPEQLGDLSDSLFSIPDSNQNAHFYRAAADVFCSCLCYLALQGKTVNSDIKNFFAAGGMDIVAALQTLPPGLSDGLVHLGKNGTDDHSGSILSTLTERCKDFSAFVMKDGDFSVRKWVREQGEGNLYISTAGPNDQRYRSVVTMLLDVIGGEVKAMPETSATKLVIVIDELASQPPLKTLSFLLNEGRSKGVCVILANQTFVKIREIYGETGAKNLFANTNSKFIFRLPEPTDAKYVSEAVGEREVIRKVRSENETKRGLLSTNGDSQGVTISEQITKEAIFLPAQIQQLPKRHALAMVSGQPVAEVQLPTMQFPAHYSPFDPLPDDTISAKEIAKELAAAAEKDTPAPDPKEEPEEDFLKL